MKKTSLGFPLGCISLIISVFPPILENTILSFFLVLMGIILILATLFANPLIIRKNHMSYRKQYAQNSIFSAIDNNNRDSNSSYTEKVMFINKFYKNHATNINDLSFCNQLGERVLFLTENLRDIQAADELLKGLILVVLLQFIIKSPIATSSNNVLIVFISIATYSGYYLVIVMSNKLNVVNELNSYEINIINNLFKDLNIRPTNKKK